MTTEGSDRKVPQPTEAPKRNSDLGPIAIANRPSDPMLEDLLKTLTRLGGEKIEWILIGGLLVHFHALARGQQPPRVTDDADIAVVLQTNRDNLEVVRNFLAKEGYTPGDVNGINKAGRFLKEVENGTLKIDVLIPAGYSQKVNRLIYGGGTATAVEAPGARSVIEHYSTMATVSGIGSFPVANLAGALVLKAAASGIAQGREKHIKDFAFLCTLVEDPDLVAFNIGKFKKQRRYIVAMSERLSARGGAVWLELNQDGARGRAAYEALLRGISH